MPANHNRRVRRSKSKAGLGAVDDEPMNPIALRMKEKSLKKQVHRMKVEMVARRLGFPIGRQPDMSLAKAAQARRRFLMQACEFLVTAILIAGACAWLYKWWLTRQ
ncbi:hypothetical protein AYO49_01200 [Verrucomicrobiaceae bacterium SCGC AG-212-N21]|nr:hypothetical protein AYO49_01200 [Verrucomicrobiaceae bacterium SCGC AG-212-N21]